MKDGTEARQQVAALPRPEHHHMCLIRKHPATTAYVVTVVVGWTVVGILRAVGVL
jgi:hypothetical protein